MFTLQSNLPLFGTAFVLFFLTSGVIYNTFFHPLAGFPGPWLAGASAVLFAYHRIRGDQHRWIHSLHERYGVVVRYLPDTLSYVDPSAWGEIFGRKANGRGDMPKDMENKMPFIGGDNSIMRMNDADHSRVRRLLAPALSEKALREQQGLLKGYVQLLCDKVKSVAESKDKIDLMTWYNFTTFDIIADLSFGESLGMLTKGQWAPWIKAINSSIPVATNVAVLTRYFPLLGGLLKIFIPSSMYESLHAHLEFSKNKVDERLARETERVDLWKYVLRNQDKQNGSLSEVENHALGQTLMVAGSETTAAALGGVTHYLLNCSDKYERLVKEIRDAHASSDDIDMDSLLELPYLNACLKEGLRLYPPTPLGQQRVAPAGGAVVCGEYVPEGTLMTISHWTAYRLSTFWHAADEFHPERWLVENQEAGPYANDKRQVFQPFSFGPRNCIGQSLAYHEARLILGTLLWNFDFELCPESRDWANQKVYGLSQRGPLMAAPKIVSHEVES